METRQPITYVYYFGFALMLFGGLIFSVAPLLPVDFGACFRISVIGLAFMLLSFFMFGMIEKGWKENGKTTSNKTESE
jgi:hypothetical protein